MVRLLKNIEVREEGGELHGVILQEGRAATGGRAEVFAPGSVTWPSDGVAIRVTHRGETETRAFPHRDNAGRINIRAKATDAIREAVNAGKRFMSVEFRALDERTTKAGVREILRAYVDGAALLANPEYDSTAAELRGQTDRLKARARAWL